MTNPTSNYGWQMPTATDLVTDLPADFEVFGQAVDTAMGDLLGGTSGQILAKNSNTNMDFVWIANDQGDITGVTAGTGISVTSPTGPVPTVAIDTAVTVDKTTAQTLTNKTLTSPALTTPTISTATTNGDILYGTGSGALARLGIGASATVLTVSGGVPVWSAPATSDSTWTLLNAGGTALTGAATITISSISTNNIFIWLSKASSASASSKITLRLNGDSGAKYNYQLLKWNTSTAGNEWGDQDTSINLGQTGNSAASSLSSTIQIAGTKSTTLVPITLASAPSGDQYIAVAGSANYEGTAAITSVSVISNTGNFDSGTIYVYGRP